jgi:methyl-accepting chemotaxis protein
MKFLKSLEERVDQLIDIAIDLSKKNKELFAGFDQVKAENEELRTENAKFAEDNAQLSAQIKAIESSLEQENETVSLLNEEKSLAKVVVDDLLRSIDALIERENQQ